jgi:AcrR family transcriptional regulator
MNDGPRTGTRRPTSARRKELVAAAAELFSSRGYYSVTVNDVCRALGLTGPALYRHFPSKEALLVAVFDQVIERQGERLRKLLADRSDPIAVLEDMVRLHGEFAISQRVNLNVWRREFQNLPEADRLRLRRAQRLYLDDCVDIVQKSRPDLGHAEARALFHGVTALLQSPADFASGVTPEPLMHLLLSMALAAIRKGSPARAAVSGARSVTD